MGEHRYLNPAQQHLLDIVWLEFVGRAEVAHRTE
jgi:hypothetical protein